MKKWIQKLLLLLIVLLAIAAAGCNGGEKADYVEAEYPEENNAISIFETYFMPQEAMYNGIRLGDSVEVMFSLYGNTEKEILDSNRNHLNEVSFEYKDAYFEANNTDNGYVVAAIRVYERTEVQSPRGIKIGDSLVDVLNKFPQEYDYTLGRFSTEPGRPLVYGGNPLREAGAVVYLDASGEPEVLLIATEDMCTVMRIAFCDGLVSYYEISDRTKLRNAFFQPDEAGYNGIMLGDPLEKVFEVYGPTEVEQLNPENLYLNDVVCKYDDAHFEAEKSEIIEGYVVGTIKVISKGDAVSPRGIKVGDSINDVIQKFPLEHPEGYQGGRPSPNTFYLYGENTMHGNAASVRVNEVGEITDLLVTTDSVVPVLKIFFADGVVDHYELWNNVM